MPTVDLEALLASTGAVLKGHFRLTSGRHSDTYFEKFRVLERADALSALCSEIATKTRLLNVDYVMGPTTGGIIIAFEVARQLGVEARYVETEDGIKQLRRGATLEPGKRVLVVDDVLTTGRSVFEVIHVVQEAEAELVGVAVLIDRSESPIDFGAPLIPAYRVEAHTFAPDDIPAWLMEIPVTKPGTRKDP